MRALLILSLAALLTACASVQGRIPDAYTVYAHELIPEDARSFAMTRARLQLELRSVARELGWRIQVAGTQGLRIRTATDLARGGSLLHLELVRVAPGRTRIDVMAEAAFRDHAPEEDLRALFAALATYREG